MENLSTYNIDKLYIPHMVKNNSICYVEIFSTCCIDKYIYIYILGIEFVFVYIAYGQFFYIPYRQLFAYIIYRQNVRMQYRQRYFRLYLI